jgi:methylphosphotriester-DNA--protein-cysteine methyltransferase
MYAAIMRKKVSWVLDFFQQIQKTTDEAARIESLKALATKLDKAVKRLGEVAMHLGTTAMSPDVKVAFAFAKPFLDVFGDVCVAWMLLWRANIAALQLEQGAKNKDTAFYEGQLQTAKYFINAIVPITMGKMDAIAAGDPAPMEIPEAAFGG